LCHVASFDLEGFTDEGGGSLFHLVLEVHLVVIALTFRPPGKVLVSRVGHGNAAVPVLQHEFIHLFDPLVPFALVQVGGFR